jgi:hypothetical protein
LHQIEDRVYDPKAISNISGNAQKTWLSDRGINTKAASAQVLVDYLSVSPDTSCVFLLHDPDTYLTGGAKKGMPKKSSPMRVMTKDFNSQVVDTEMVPEMSAEQYVRNSSKKGALLLAKITLHLTWPQWLATDPFLDK